MNLPHAIPGLVALSLLCLLLGGVSPPCHAQVDGPHLQLGLGYGAAWFEQWLGIENGGAWSARLAYHPLPPWGIEFQWDHVSSDTRPSAGSGTSTFNFYALGVRHDFLPFRPFSPFAAISLGYTQLRVSDTTNQGLGLGLAAGVNWRAWRQLALYAELKDDLAGFRGSLTHQLMFSVGLRFSFGITADGDGDGVSDGRDLCPDTPVGAVVDERGCPSDPDGDGVPDGLDECPGTPLGTAVDERGCPSQRGAPPLGG